MYRKRWLICAVSLLLLFYSLLLFVHAYYHTPALIGTGSVSKKWHKESHLLRGKVVSDPQLLNDQLRFLMRLDQGEFAGYSVKIRVPTVVASSEWGHVSGLQVSPSTDLISEQEFQEQQKAWPKVGELWQCDVQIRQAGGFRNPGAPHYGSTLAAKKVLGFGVAKDLWVTVCKKLEHIKGVDMIRDAVRQRLLRAEKDAGRALALALLLGDRSELTPEIRQPVADAGLSHVLAVSGMHVGIMAWLGAWVGHGVWRFRSRAGRFGSKSREVDRIWWRVAGALVLAGMYGLLSGFALPAQRAYIALVIVLLTRLFVGESSWSAALLGSLVAVLLISPLAPMTLDFWCSFGALTLLWLVFDRQHQRLNFWQSLFKSQLLLTFGLLPFVVLMSDQLSLLSPVWNALVIPLLTFVLLPGLMLSLSLSVYSFEPLLAMIQLMTLFVEGFQQAMLSWPLLVELTLTQSQSIALALVALCWVKLAFRTWFGFALCFLALAFLPWQRPKIDQFWVDVLDVGQGNAILVRTRSQTLLYDTGAKWRSGRDAAQAVVLPYMRTQGVANLSALIVSHEDNDHAGGVASVLEKRPPAVIISSFDAALMVAENSSPLTLGCDRLRSWWWDGVLFQVFQAPGIINHPRISANTSNNRSCLLRISVDDQAVLLPGDIEIEAEQTLASIDHLLKANMVVAPHHGSQTSSSTGFIHRVDPELVVFTASEPSRFGHPTPYVVARYLVRGIKTHHTGRQGALHWRSK